MAATKPYAVLHPFKWKGEFKQTGQTVDLTDGEFLALEDSEQTKGFAGHLSEAAARELIRAEKIKAVTVAAEVVTEAVKVKAQLEAEQTAAFDAAEVRIGRAAEALGRAEALLEAQQEALAEFDRQVEADAEAMTKPKRGRPRKTEAEEVPA